VLHHDDVFEALRAGVVVPTVATTILATTVGPQVPHLGGAFFDLYAHSVVADAARFLGVSNEGLVATTRGYEPCKRSGKGNLQGIFSYYPELGARIIREAIGYDK
jgi:hypothetical protein